MQFSIASARAIGFALLSASLVACADSRSATAPDAGADASFRTMVTPLSLAPQAGTTLRALVAVENIGAGATSSVSTVCLADVDTGACGPVLTQLAMANIVERGMRADTAAVALPLLPSAFVDVPQRVRVRVCTARDDAGSSASCASSAVVRVMPNFEAACGTTALAMGDSAVGTGDTGTCTLASTGDRSKLFAVPVRGNDTLVVTLDAHGLCTAAVAVFDRDGEIVGGRQVCGPAAEIKVPVTYGGTYHVAIGGVDAGYALQVRYADVAVDTLSGNAP